MSTEQAQTVRNSDIDLTTANDLSDAELRQLDQLEKNATQQPWCEDPEGAPPWFIVSGDPTTNAEAVACINETVDMALIVTVRRQLPRLIAEVCRRRYELERRVAELEAGMARLYSEACPGWCGKFGGDGFIDFLANNIKRYREDRERDLAGRDAEIGRLREALKFVDGVIRQSPWAHYTEMSMARNHIRAALAPQPATEAKPDAYSRQMDLLDGKVPENPLPDPMHTRY